MQLDDARPACFAWAVFAGLKYRTSKEGGVQVLCARVKLLKLRALHAE